MSVLKEITLDEYYDLPLLKIVKYKDSDGVLQSKTVYPKLKVGRTYRHPNVLPKSSRNVNLTTIIGIETQKVPHFEYAYPPEIKRLHIEERKVYVKTEEE
jgi:hypothetical protein